METTRKVLAIVIGLLIIVAVVLLARFVGDKVREKFLMPKPVAKVSQVVPAEQAEAPQVMMTANKSATYSAIPATGPESFGYLLLAILFLGGVSSLALSRRVAS